MESSSFIYGTGSCLNCEGMFQGTGLGACCCWVLAVPWACWFSAYHLHPKVTCRRGEGVHLCLPFPAGGGLLCLPWRETQAVAFAMSSICADSWGAGQSPTLGAFPHQLLAPAHTWEFTQLYIHLSFLFPLHLVRCRARKVCASALGSAPRPVWLEDATYVLGLEPGPLRLPNVPTSLPRGCGGVRSPGAPASCPGSSVEHEECSCQLFITVLKLSQLAKRPGDTATAACWSLQRTLLFAWPRCFAGGRALAATAQAVSSGAFSLYIGCTSHRIPSGAAGAGRSGTAV